MMFSLVEISQPSNPNHSGEVEAGGGLTFVEVDGSKENDVPDMRRQAFIVSSHVEQSIPPMTGFDDVALDHHERPSGSRSFMNVPSQIQHLL